MYSIAKKMICLSFLLAAPCFAQTQGAPPSQDAMRGPSGPSGGPGPKRHKPPQESLDACKDKKSGDSCSFKGKEGSAMTGTCGAPKADLPLGCKPDRGPEEQKK